MLRGNVSWWVWPQAVQRLGWMGCDCRTCAARPPPWLPPRVRRPRSRWRASATGRQGGAALPAWLTDRQATLAAALNGLAREATATGPRPGRGQGRTGVPSAGPGREPAGRLVERRPEQLGPPVVGGAGGVDLW